jgi:hypothetical protein
MVMRVAEKLVRAIRQELVSGTPPQWLKPPLELRDRGYRPHQILGWGRPSMRNRIPALIALALFTATTFGLVPEAGASQTAARSRSGHS